MNLMAEEIILKGKDAFSVAKDVARVLQQGGFYRGEVQFGPIYHGHPDKVPLDGYMIHDRTHPNIFGSPELAYVKRLPEGCSVELTGIPQGRIADFYKGLLQL